MRIVAISDTHGYYPELPDGDVLIHCGDATKRGTETQHREFVLWLANQPHKIKLFVSGNHDLYSESLYTEGTEYMACDLEDLNPLQYNTTAYLRDREVTISGFGRNSTVFYGTPSTPNFNEWAFMYMNQRQGHEHFSKIPEGIDVLI